MIRMSDRARLMQEDLLNDSEDGGKMRFAPSAVQKMSSFVGENSNTSTHSAESYQSSCSSERARGYDGQNPQEQERFSWFVLLLTTISAIGGFLFGYDTGVISGATLLITKRFDLSDEEKEVVVSITIVSAAVAAVAGGPGMERFGRKPSILLAAVIFTVGAVLLAAARSYVELVVGRLVVGLGIGLASLATPVYIAEAAPSNVRGTLVTLNTLFITVGMVVAGVVDGLFANVDGGWRWMLGLSGIPSLLMAVGFLMSDSARLMQEDLINDSEDDGKMRFAPSAVQKMPSSVGENSTSTYSAESYQSSCSSERARGYDGQNPQEQGRFSWFVLLLTTISAIGGFLFGYDTGVISGAMLLITKRFDLSDEQEEVVVSITIASAVVAAVAGGPGMERFGRKPSILLAAIIFTVGAVLLAAARSYVELVFGRLVIGLGIGLASLTTPVYIAEAAPSNVRGTLVTLNTLFITVGQVVAGVVDGLFANVDGGWRWMLGLSGIPSLLMTVGFLILPESPRWLVSCGRRREALLVLQRIRGSADVHSELEEMVQSVTDDSGGLRKSVTARGLLADPRIRRALVLGCGLQFLQQLCGINTVMYYSATIFSMAGFSDEASIWLAAVTAAAQSAGVCLGLYFVEVCGRRQLALTSLGLVVCALVSLGAGFYLYEDEEKLIALYTSSSSTNTYGWLVAGAMMAYLFTFGIGMSSVPWTINAEIYPTHARSLGTSASTTTSWVGNVLVSATFLSLAKDNVLGKPGAFWLYASIGVAGWVWLFSGMPETKGLSLEEIEQLFEREGDPPRPGDSPGGPSASLTGVTDHNGDFAMSDGMPGTPDGVLDTESWAGARNSAMMT